MPFKETGQTIDFIEVDGKKIPRYRCETEVTLTNTQTKKEFLEGDESTLLVLEESDILKFTTTATSANISVSVLQQDRT